MIIGSGLVYVSFPYFLSVSALDGFKPTNFGFVAAPPAPFQPNLTRLNKLPRINNLTFYKYS
jgi:hypothetical protein